MFVQNVSDRDNSTKTIDKIIVVIKTIVYIIGGFLVYPFLVLGEKREGFVSNTVSNNTFNLLMLNQKYLRNKKVSGKV